MTQRRVMHLDETGLQTQHHADHADHACGAGGWVRRAPPRASGAQMQIAFGATSQRITSRHFTSRHESDYLGNCVVHRPTVQRIRTRTPLMVARMRPQRMGVPSQPLPLAIVIFSFFFSGLKIIIISRFSSNRRAVDCRVGSSLKLEVHSSSSQHQTR
jgi:hypothetical protein